MGNERKECKPVRLSASSFTISLFLFKTIFSLLICGLIENCKRKRDAIVKGFLWQKCFFSPLLAFVFFYFIWPTMRKSIFLATRNPFLFILTAINHLFHEQSFVFSFNPM